jgi:hypothetical protein
MGSAFYADGLGSRETVLFSLSDISDDPWVAHLRHDECPIEHPHRMSECGRFEHVPNGTGGE